jgi:hypothetical protein
MPPKPESALSDDLEPDNDDDEDALGKGRLID